MHCCAPAVRPHLGRMRAVTSLFRPAWPQVPGDAGARRLRVLLLVPVVVPIALASAPWVARHLPLAYGAAALCIAGALLLLPYLAAVLGSAVTAALNAHDDDSIRKLTDLVADLTVGAVAGRLLAPALELEVITAISTGAVFLAMYNAIVTRLLLGELGEAIGTFLVMPTGIRPSPQYSRADALAVRGRYDDALAELSRAAASAPRDAGPLLHGARILRDRAHRPEEAVLWLRRARERIRAPCELDARVGRETAEILLHTLRRPDRAAAELARLAATYRATPTGRWAAAELREIRARNSASG
jgi:tetratricopeptide (TPR) repeat protein